MKTILITLCVLCLSVSGLLGVERPAVPYTTATAGIGQVVIAAVPATAVVPASFAAPISTVATPADIVAAGNAANVSAVNMTATVVQAVAPSELAVAQSSIDNRQSPFAVAEVTAKTPESIKPEAASEGDVTHLILSCDDDAALRALLADMGVALRAQEKVRALPDFVTAVSSFIDSFRHYPVDGKALENVPAAAGVKVVRYVANSDEAVRYVVDHPDQRFIVVVDINNLTASALRSLGGQNIVAVVVGHYHAADALPTEYATAAADAQRVIKAIRLVSDTPVLLAVSVTNWWTRAVEPGWASAFTTAGPYGAETLNDFDGWAIYGLQNFPAILEAPQGANPRTAMLARLGLPDKPCWLLDFTGTGQRIPKGKTDYIKKVWEVKAPLLLAALHRQGWRGVIVWSSSYDPADGKLKAEALKAASTAALP